MRERGTKRNISGLSALLVFAVFAVCIGAVLLTGAETCQRLSCRDQDSYDRRTAAQYITTRVRQSDGEGLVYPADLGTSAVREQGDALFLLDPAEEEICTRIYFYDGYIRELYCDVSGNFSPEDGEKILKAEGVWFSLEDGLLTVEIGYGNTQRDRFVLALRSGEEVR